MDAIEQLAVSHHVTKLTHFENRNRIESIQHFSFVGNFFPNFQLRTTLSTRRLIFAFLNRIEERRIYVLFCSQY